MASPFDLNMASHVYYKALVDPLIETSRFLREEGGGVPDGAHEAVGAHRQEVLR